MNQNHTKLNDLGLPLGTNLKVGLEISPRDARAMMDRGELLLIDCRTQAEFDLVHLPGSVPIPLDEIERRADDIEPKPGQHVAVICHHGVRSLKAALALRALGHPGVLSVAGGIELWSLAVDAGVPRYERSSGTPRFI